MNRYLAIILVGLVLAGCTSQGQTPTSDPFLIGRTRIPPPATGAASGQCADPYYSAPPAPLSPPTTWQPPASAATSSPAQPTSQPGFVPTTSVPTAPSTPGGGTNYRGVSLQGARPLVSPPAGTSPSLSVGASPDNRSPRPIDNTGGNLAGPKPIVRTIQPRAKDDASDRLIDITDLPAAP